MKNYQRYFISKEQIYNHTILITNNDVHHMLNVMRMKKGDIALFVIENETVFRAELLSITRNEASFSIIDTITEDTELNVDVCIAQGFVKKEKEEEIIEKLVELGCNNYIPVIMEYSNAKYYPETKEKRLIRYEKIVKEASEQSHRLVKMKINDPLTFSEFIKQKHNYELFLFAYEHSTIRDSFKSILKRTPKSILVVIGPEGGFSENEVKELLFKGFIPINLGKRILRTELASAYIMSAISYEIESGDENAL